MLTTPAWWRSGATNEALKKKNVFNQLQKHFNPGTHTFLFLLCVKLIVMNIFNLSMCVSVGLAPLSLGP